MAGSSLKYAFTLVELLVVIAIVSLLALVVGPALQALSSAGAVNNAISELSQTYDLARTYALANHTFVRVALGQVPSGGSLGVPATVVLAICPADGTLTADTSAAMTDAAQWPSLNKPLILQNLCVYNSLNSTSPDTSGDATPSSTNIVSWQRKVLGLGTVTFDSIVQFTPNGEAGVNGNEPSRYIKIGMDQPRVPSNPATELNKNPFVLRLSGINGTISILRKENL